MPGPSYVLDKTYAEQDSSGCKAYVCLVNYATDGSGDGKCKLPTAASPAIVGISQEAQSKQYENVAVRVEGISYAYAKGTVNAGNLVECYYDSGGTENGYVQAVTPATSGSTPHIIIGQAVTSGTDGTLIAVLLSGVGSPCVTA
jgi:hypothetical protein